jgi:hypothetical protein
MRSASLGILALGMALAACGSNTEQRSATGAGSGILAGALVGGPVGAVVGAATGGAALDEGVDKKAEDAVEKAKRDDKAAGVSGSSTATASAARVDADTIRANLRKDGYTNVGSFRREGDLYKATATKNGQHYDLTIDARSGDLRNSRAI